MTRRFVHLSTEFSANFCAAAAVAVASFVYIILREVICKVEKDVKERKEVKLSI